MEKFERKGHTGVKFFVGGEIEQTPAFNKKTLFVVGLQDIAEIEKYAKEHNTKHIFLSANRSFDSIDKVNGVYKVGNTLASDWGKQIQQLLNLGYMVSLDYPAHKHAMVLEVLDKSIWQNRNFVPVLSVAVPHVTTSSPNLTIKIDDINFGATNPGVWCMNYAEVTDSNRFTGWEEYGDDTILEQDATEVQPPSAPVVEPEVVKEVEVVPAPVLNDASVGLDTVEKSSLKPEEVVPVTPEVAANAYAEGATDDPLSGKDPKKLKPKGTK